jgi:hypothetical protein
MKRALTQAFTKVDEPTVIDLREIKSDMRVPCDNYLKNKNERMKSNKTLALLVGLLPTFLVAQESIQQLSKETDFSIGAGPGYLFGAGTAASTDDFSSSDIGLDIDTAYKHYLLPGIAYNAELLFAFISGNELDARLQNRGYTFKSYVGEASLQFNWQLISFFARKASPIDPYAILGPGIIGAYIPWWEFSDPLRPDATDKLRHKTIGGEIIGGLGIRIKLSHLIGLCFECSYHDCTTDYLDGYHPASSKHSDVYLVSLAKVSYRLYQHGQ